VEELPSDSLKRIRDTYKALRSVAGSMREELGQQLTAMQAKMATATHSNTTVSALLRIKSRLPVGASKETLLWHMELHAVTTQ
jgi:hypothetical protein